MEPLAEKIVQGRIFEGLTTIKGGGTEFQIVSERVQKGSTLNKTGGAMKEEDPFFREDFKRCVEFHGHICPGLVLGYRAAKAGLEWLREHRAADEELVTIVETDSCGVDAVQVLTGCTFGKGNFIFKDHGKMAFTFLSRQSGKGVRVARKASFSRPSDRHGELIQKVRSGEASPEEEKEFRSLHIKKAQQIFTVPMQDLFVMQPGEYPVPAKASLEPSKPCTQCGEPVMASR
jgi:formylmethanofuran dehydrogenase subunit E